MAFVPLHVYSGYSYLKSGLKLENYIKSALKYGYKSLGLCDFNSFSGLTNFANLANKNGIKDILGQDIEIDGIIFSFFIINEFGYKSLLKLINKYRQNELTLENFPSLCHGLVVVLDINNRIIKDKFDSSSEVEFAKYFNKITKDITNFYVGINDDKINTDYIDKFRDFAISHIYKCVAFPFIKYINKEDAIVLKMCEAIKDEKKLESKSFSGNEYLLSNNEVEHLYTIEEIKNSEEIASIINFNIMNKRGKMISYANDLGLDSSNYLKKLTYDGLNKLSINDEAHQKRAKKELDVISSMDFSDYFLIVQDYVNWARNNNIPVGPGRGSAAGSLVSYALGITRIDPLKYDLLFERFLNKERVTMPDIDVDFSDIKRNDVTDYIREKYGHNKVSNIITIQTFGARQSLRDVGRIFSYPNRDIELLTRLIPRGNKNYTLRETYKTVKAFKDLIDNDKYYLEIVSLASKIEGLPRQTGMHPAGVVINAEDLDEILPVLKDINDNYIEEYEMNYLEGQGFLKMDILSLSNLTIVEQCLEKININGEKLTFDSIPSDDKKAIENIKKGITAGIFQLESSGMRNAISILEPESLEDVGALLALYRPGPMQEIKTYAKRKKGIEKIQYIDPCLSDILSSTYGVIIYQEQISQIVSKMAGLSLAEADMFRRAISKKDSERFDELRDIFINGALKNGHSRNIAIETYDLIIKFANYGFNKSHALSYAVFSTKMAYLKTYYKYEFYCSILDNVNVESDTFSLINQELKNNKIAIKNPDINVSENRFIIDNECLIYPLNRIKDIHNDLSQNILKERNLNGLFTDYYDFVLRMFKYKMKPEHLLRLINAGALDSLDNSRASLRINVPNAFSYASLIVDDDGIQIIDVKDFAKPIYTHIEDDEIENLNLEKNSLGIMLSGSYFNMYKEELSAYNIININEITQHKEEVYISSIIKNIKNIKTKRGEPMAFIELFDESGEIDATIFPEVYEISRDLIKINQVLLFKGKYQQNRNSFVVGEIINLKGK